MKVIGIMLLIAVSRSFGGDGEKFWVFFTDKTHEVCQYDTVECHLLPPDYDKINAIEELGVIVVNKSNWLNAISVLADVSQREQIVNLDFVERVSPVKRLTPSHHQAGDLLFPMPLVTSATFSQAFDRMSLNQNYGLSAAQLKYHRIDKVHELGFDGSDVIVGVMDGGFNSNHEAFNHLRNSRRILAERDFVDGGNDTKANVIDLNYQSHGTSVAAIIAGKIEGVLMGVAPGVSLVLARTEDDKQEAPIEEDNWVAAIEWMQTLGVQLVNSSLGYNIFTSKPSASYKYNDMDGKTSAIARAATKAASVFNMVVVVSAGNEGTTSWKYITTPADADSIIAVGSLTSNGSKALSSSIGPTSDGRIKPDVSARGECVFTARSVVTDSNGSRIVDSGTTSCISGTSFASPHVAGMMALAMQARPGMPAIWYVKQARKASSLYPTPNNLIGYGKIDALDLISGVTTSISSENPNQLPDDAFITRNFPNPFNPSTTIFYQVPGGWFLKDVRIYDVTGRAVSTIQHSDISATGTMQWNGYNMVGAKVASGIYFARFNFTNGVASKVLMHPMSFIK
jgi:serine protease AprX